MQRTYSAYREDRLCSHHTFGMAMDGLRSPALCQDIPHSSHEGGLWPDWFRVCARMDSPLKKILPHCLWREDVDEVLWPDAAKRWCWVFFGGGGVCLYFYAFFFSPQIFLLFMFYFAFRICSDFQCNTQPLEMHGCIDWFYNLERNKYVHQCTVLVLCVVFGQSCTVL